MTNSSPSTCVRMLHRMDDRLYDVQTVANIFNKAKKILLEEKGVDTSSTKAQQLVDYLMTNPDTNAVIVIHDPSSALIDWRKREAQQEEGKSFGIIDEDVKQRSVRGRARF
jgi:hypothetical protein